MGRKKLERKNREFVVDSKYDACAGACFSLFRDMGCEGELSIAGR